MRAKKKSLDKRQNIRLDDQMLDLATLLADEEDRTVSSILRILVRESLVARGVLTSDKVRRVSTHPSRVA